MAQTFSSSFCPTTRVFPNHLRLGSTRAFFIGVRFCSARALSRSGLPSERQFNSNLEVINTQVQRHVPVSVHLEPSDCGAISKVALFKKQE